MASLSIFILIYHADTRTGPERLTHQSLKGGFSRQVVFRDRAKFVEMRTLWHKYMYAIFQDIGDRGSLINTH